jgi:hypothetical protein
VITVVERRIDSENLISGLAWMVYLSFELVVLVGVQGTKPGQSEIDESSMCGYGVLVSNFNLIKRSFKDGEENATNQTRNPYPGER